MWKEISEFYDFGTDPLLEGVLVNKIESKELLGGERKENMKYLIESKKHGIITILGSKVLDGKLKSVSVGDLIRIEYLGEKRSKSGFLYADYKVYKDDDILRDFFKGQIVVG